MVKITDAGIKNEAVTKNYVEAGSAIFLNLNLNLNLPFHSPG